MRSLSHLVNSAQAPLDRTQYLPILLQGQAIGWVAENFVVHCAAERALFDVSSTHLDMTPDPTMLAQVVEVWHQAGRVPHWRGESMDALHPHAGQRLFGVERGVRGLLGLTMAGVHLNAFTKTTEGLKLWVAQRATIKRIDPLKWDNCADGGVASGESAWEAILREAWEEAGIPLSHMQWARAASVLKLAFAVDSAPFFEWAHTFDVELPADFSPRNQDGEVAQFALLSVNELLDWIENDRFSLDAAVTCLDWCARMRVLPDAQLCAALRKLHDAPPA